MNLTTVIPVTIDTAIIAERLIDWIYQLSGRQKSGAALLVYNGVPEENQMRLRIAAELAFESFDELVAPTAKDSPIAAANRAFLSAAEYCQKTYRIPWLYLPSNAVPLEREWLNKVESAFMGQPKRYMGTHMKPSAESNEVFLMPSSVYHMGAFNDCHRSVLDAMEVPFELSCGSTFTPKSTKSRLIQPLKIVDESDFEKVWEDAVVVVGDTSGALIEKLRAEGKHLNKFPGLIVSEIMDSIAQDSKNTPQKIDLRTKAGRALKASGKA